MTTAVQAPVQDMRNEMTEKINHSVSYFLLTHQFGDLWGRLSADVETAFQCLAAIILADCATPSLLLAPLRMDSTFST